MNYISLQEDELDCGFACLKMQLAYIHKNRHFLSLEKEKRNKEYSFLELKKIASKYSLNLNGVEFTEKEKIFEYKNVICQIKVNDKTHFIFFVKATKKTVIINDPTFGQVEMNKEDFLDMFLGDALIEENHSKISFKNNNKLVNVSYLFLYAFTLLIDFALIYILGCFASNTNGLILSAFVIIGIIISMVSKSVIITSQNKKIDDKVKDLLYELSNKKFTLSYLEKKHLLSLKGNLINAVYNNINNLAISLFITAILIMNGLYHILIIIIILLVIILMKLLDDSKNKYIKYKLFHDENAFMNANINLDVLYSNLSFNSTEYVKNNLFSSVTIYALIAILVSASNYLQNINSFTYIIFFIAYYYVLSDKMQYLVYNYEDKMNEYNTSKNLYFGISNILKD